MPVLEIEGLSIRRGDRVLLDQIDWRVGAGEHWVMLGANGSGKTTLLKVFCGYMPPTAGTVRVLGKTYGHADWNRLRTRIGIVSNSVGRRIEGRESALSAVISGKDAIFNFWGNPSPRDARRGDTILARVGLTGFAEAPWDTLSQGERQRVLIGRALMGNPRLLLLDEPCAGLDPVARDAFLHFLQDLLRKPDTPATILVTHHVEEIVPRLSHLLLLREGATVASGPLPDTLTSANLRRAFGPRIQLLREGRRYHLKVRTSEAGLF